MDGPRIEFRDVRKTFRLRNRSDALRDALPRAFARLLGRTRERTGRFTALDGVSFTVDDGEVVGIIGANGAGKSTSLRLAAGIYRPDSGLVSVRGRVSALIELRAGFHPDLSGRENIFLVGALLGLRRREVRDLVGPIAEFADIGEFLDAPVRTYSTGMAVRLGFAVAAHVPAEVMLVDEVLAVGDVEFQAKCLRRLSERRDEGIAVLFVSHNLEIVEKFCERVILVHRGVVVLDGGPREAIAEYRRLLSADRGGDATGRGHSDARRRLGTHDLVLEDVVLDGGPDGPRGTVEHGAPLTIRARWIASEAVPSPKLELGVHTVEGLHCASIVTGDVRGAPAVWEGRGELTIELPRVDLLPGSYDLSLIVRDAGGLVVHDHHHRVHPLTVVGESPPGASGILHLPAAWSACVDGAD